MGHSLYGITKSESSMTLSAHAHCKGCVGWIRQTLEIQGLAQYLVQFKGFWQDRHGSGPMKGSGLNAVAPFQ